MQLSVPNHYIDRLLNAYGLDVDCRLDMQTGYRNQNYPVVLRNGAMVNLILYKREPDIQQAIQNANRLGDYLSARAYPARRTYDPRILRISTTSGVRFAAVYEYLPGGTIPWEGYTMDHLKSLGKSMSDMHSLLATIPQSTLSHVCDVYPTLLARMVEYFSDLKINTAIDRKLSIFVPVTSVNGFQKTFTLIALLPKQQPLHLDFVRSNILFANNAAEITGILDFEKAAYGHPVIDVARTLAFLLVDCKYKTEEQIRKYFLISGYNKRGQAQIIKPRVKQAHQEIDVLEHMINFFLLHDFYKFLRHNPYESLYENEHYIKTRDLLIARGVIHPIS